MEPVYFVEINQKAKILFQYLIATLPFKTGENAIIWDNNSSGSISNRLFCSLIRLTGLSLSACSACLLADITPLTRIYYLVVW